MSVGSSCNSSTSDLYCVCNLIHLSIICDWTDFEPRRLVGVRRIRAFKRPVMAADEVINISVYCTKMCTGTCVTLTGILAEY